MPCLIIAGREIDCRDSTGGVAEIYLTEFNNVPQANITSSSGTVSAATCSAGKRFFTYQLEKENASFEEKAAHSVENGTTMVDMTLSFTLKKMSAALKNNLLTLGYNRLHIIVKDKNGVYHWMGQTGGADMITSDGATGKAMGDMNGYTLTFNAKEPIYSNTVSAAIVASLQIGS